MRAIAAAGAEPARNHCGTGIFSTAVRSQILPSGTANDLRSTRAGEWCRQRNLASLRFRLVFRCGDRYNYGAAVCAMRDRQLCNQPDETLGPLRDERPLVASARGIGHRELASRRASPSRCHRRRHRRAVRPCGLLVAGSNASALAKIAAKTVPSKRGHPPFIEDASGFVVQQRTD